MYDRLAPFLEEQTKDIDIFCFQEVFDNPDGTPSVCLKGADVSIFLKLSRVLDEYNGCFCSSQKDERGLCIFVRKRLKASVFDGPFIHRWEDALVDGNPSTLGCNVQYAEFTSHIVCNVHGAWFDGPKRDNEHTIAQSEKILMFLETLKKPVVLCGDFNLALDTKSISMIESSMHNLIREYNIKSVRPAFFEWPEKHADYIFVSPDVQVKEFKVLPDEISDHLPLYIEFF